MLFTLDRHEIAMSTSVCHAVAEWPIGTAVEITGLEKAAQHNGKTGRVSTHKNDRVGIKLGNGSVLAVRPENLKIWKASEPEGTQRTLTREDALFREFDGNPDPDMLVLYHHLRDRSFDFFNAADFEAFADGHEDIRLLEDQEGSL